MLYQGGPSSQRPHRGDGFAPGVVLWDVVRSERLAVIPGYRHPLSFTRDGTLITCNRLPEGVASWLVAADPEHPERLTVGASRQLVQENGENVVFRHWSTSADGRVIAMPNENRGANVFLMKSTDGSPTERYQKVVLGPQYDVRHTAVSPDGQWVVTGSLSFAGAVSPEQVSVTIWESATGKRIKDLLAGPGDPCFSADGAWLVVLSGEYSGGAGAVASRILGARHDHLAHRATWWSHRRGLRPAETIVRRPG